MGTEVTWCQARRLDYIDWLLVTGATLRRERLMTAFNISESQASMDISLFRETFPDALEYDRSNKNWTPAEQPYRSRRDWTAEALAAMDSLARAKHPMAWRE